MKQVIAGFKYYDEQDKEKDIDLEFRMLSCSDSLEFLIFLGKVIGGQVGEALSSFDADSFESLSNIKEEDIKLEKISNAFFGIFKRLDSKEAIANLNLLLGSVRHSGNILSLDYLIFDGNPDLALKVAKKAIEVNYKRFLQGIFGSIKTALEKVAKNKAVGQV